MVLEEQRHVDAHIEPESGLSVCRAIKLVHTSGLRLVEAHVPEFHHLFSRTGGGGSSGLTAASGSAARSDSSGLGPSSLRCWRRAALSRCFSIRAISFWRF